MYDMVYYWPMYTDTSEMMTKVILYCSLSSAILCLCGDSELTGILKSRILCGLNGLVNVAPTTVQKEGSQKHMPPVGLVLYCKMVAAMSCLIWLLAMPLLPIVL